MYRDIQNPEEGCGLVILVFAMTLRFCLGKIAYDILVLIQGVLGEQDEIISIYPTRFDKQTDNPSLIWHNSGTVLAQFQKWTIQPSVYFTDLTLCNLFLQTTQDLRQQLLKDGFRLDEIPDDEELDLIPPRPMNERCICCQTTQVTCSIQ